MTKLITGNKKQIFIDAQKLPNVNRYEFVVRKNGLLPIPCKPTHPNVTVSLTYVTIYIGHGVARLGDLLSREEYWLTNPRFIKKPTKVNGQFK